MLTPAYIATFFLLAARGVTSEEDLVEAEGSQEYCQWETFKASCPDHHVVVMQSAIYGRMKYGRCIRRDYGYVGCSRNVLTVMDSHCSGRQKCEITVPHRDLERTQSCPEDLKLYLSASYTCVAVVSGYLGGCEGSVEVTAGQGFLSSEVSRSTGCGSASSPWLLTARPGQRINLTLHDYGLYRTNVTTTPVAGTKPLDGRASGGTQHCHVYAILKDSVNKQATTVCASTSGLVTSRVSHVMTSQGAEITVRLVTGRTRQSAQYLLEFSVIGCADLTMPSNAWIRRQGDEAEVGCSQSDRTWEITCVDGVWQGDMGDCASAATGEMKSRPDSFPSFAHATSIGLIMGIAVIIAVCILILGLCFLKKRRRQSASNQGNRGTPLTRGKTAGTYTSSQKGGEYKTQKGADYKTQKTGDYKTQKGSEYKTQKGSEYKTQRGSDYKSQPPFFSRQEMYTAEDNEYAYVEEFQFSSPPTCTCPGDGGKTCPSESGKTCPGETGGKGGCPSVSTVTRSAPSDPYGLGTGRRKTSSPGLPPPPPPLPHSGYEPTTRPRRPDDPPQYFVLDPDTLPSGRARSREHLA